MIWLVPAAFSLAAWVYLLVGRGAFWRTSVRFPQGHPPPRWPAVVAIVPARDEATLLPQTLPSLLAQQYPGEFAVVVVDDESSDGTGELARSLGARVLASGGPPPGWAGKVAAMAAGMRSAGDAEYLLFADADITYPPGALTELVRVALGNRLDLVSQMVRLRTRSGWERLVVPAFVYFFAQLYPFSRVNQPGSRTAAAAGGCMLVRRVALDEAGGFARIAGALIDDVALGRLIKRSGRRIWLGLSGDIRSLRPYPRLDSAWRHARGRGGAWKGRTG